jgi:ankyrin repeat protein
MEKMTTRFSFGKILPFSSLCFFSSALLVSSCAFTGSSLKEEDIDSLAKEAYQAVRRGDAKAFEGYLSRGLPVNYGRGDKETPLHWAAQLGQVDIAKLLLARKADVNARSFVLETPLHGAVYYDHEDVVKLLLEHKADPNLGGG